jgi:hypothetical protein
LITEVKVEVEVFCRVEKGLFDAIAWRCSGLVKVILIGGKDAEK